MNLDAISLIDKEKGRLLSIIFKRIKKLLYNTYNQEGIRQDEEEMDDNDKYLNKHNNIINLEEDDFNKADDYYNMFISKILTNKFIFFIENKWNVQDFKQIINYNHL